MRFLKKLLDQIKNITAKIYMFVCLIIVDHGESEKNNL